MPADRLVLENLGVGAWIVDADGRTAYANPAFASLVGQAPTALEGLPWLELIAADGHAAARDLLAQCRQGAAGQADLPLRTHDDAVRWALCVHAATAADGAVTLVVVDIDVRHQVEQALQRTASHYRVLAQHAPDHIFVIDRDDRVEYVNRAAAEQFQTTPDRLIGRLRTEIFPPDVAERQGRSLRRVFDTGQPFAVEGRTMYAGREVWLNTSLAPVLDEQGAARAVLGVSRDMTIRKQAEDALLASEQRLRVVLSNVPVILWATDRDGRVTFCEGLALDARVTPASAIAGRTFEEIAIAPFDWLREHQRRALAGETCTGHTDVDGLRFEAWSIPLRDDTGAITGATGVMVDITERLRLETELSNAAKLEAIGRLSGGIAHDFNNTLTAILGYVEMMRNDAPAGTRLADDLKEVQQAAERAAGLVRRLLAFGRRQVAHPRSLDLGSIIEGLVPMLGRLIGERIQVTVAIDPALRPVSGDPSEFEQIIMNLALNARDAMPHGGTLTIAAANVAITERNRRSTMTDGPHLLLTVGDTGTGMDAQTRDRAFEPFFTTKPMGEGTGLGLSTVYGIVKQLSGFIWVESEVGTGTTFSVYVPAADAAVTPAVAVEMPALPPAVRRGTVLLVEDEPTVLRFAKRALELYGFSVLHASTPEEALAIAAAPETAMSLLLTDVVMPRMSGPELAARVRQARPDLAVLFMSGYPAGLVLPEHLDPSMRLISKPFRLTDLLKTIEELLTRA